MKAGEGIGVAWGEGESSFHYTGYMDTNGDIMIRKRITGER